MSHRERSSSDDVLVDKDAGILLVRSTWDRPRSWTLFTHGVFQSSVDLDDPTWLDFPYIRQLGHVVDLLAPPGAPLRVLHLGGGALTLPRYIATTRPRSGQQVVEVDGTLVEVVRHRLPLDRSWRIQIHIGDAREVLAKGPQDTFDLLIVDAYIGHDAPAHLTTTEFVALAARALRAGGSYAVNLMDDRPLDFARAQVATIQTAFPYAALIAESEVVDGRSCGNLVVVANREGQPVDLAGLTRLTACDPVPARVVYGEELTRFVAGAAPVTDATAQPEPGRV